MIELCFEVSVLDESISRNACGAGDILNRFHAVLG